MKTKALLLSLVIACCGTKAFAQGTDFTYQGYLTDNGGPANGVYDLQFTVYNALAVGATVGATTTVNDLAITNGLFTTELDFGANVFAGEASWLDIAVSTNNGQSFVTLLPRVRVAPTPNAIYASKVGNGAVQASQLATTGAPGPGPRAAPFESCASMYFPILILSAVLPSPNRFLKSGRSCGVEMIRISRIPASIRTESG